MVEKKYTKVRYRFAATLITNILKVVLSFISGIIIARSLGPAQYGDFNFLLGSFTALINLVDLASSSAFYTIISKKKRGGKFYLYYAIWVLVQLLILLLFVLLLPVTITDKIWLGHSRYLVLLALFSSFTMIKIWQFSGQIGESIRDTIGVQTRNLTLFVIYLICVLSLVAFNVLSIERLFIINAIIYFLFSILYAVRIYQTGTFSVLDREDLTGVFKEFKEFCSPLIIYTVIGFFYTFVDYWLLQRFGGSTQQGYYAIAFRFSTVVLIATTSILQVFWKEISEAYSKNNIERVQLLYFRISKSFFFFGMVISCFLIPHTKQIIALFLGSAYMEAWLTLSLMIYYPVHQSMGQITSTVLFAISKTKAASYIGIFFMLISIFTAYFVLAPKSAIVPGFDLGSTGLALKMVGCQILGVNISAFFVARYINISFDWIHQIKVLCLLPISIFSKLFSNYLFALGSIQDYTILSMIISGILYLLSVAVLIYFFPLVTGLDRIQIKQGLFWLRARF